MTQTNDNEAIRTNEPCIEVTRNGPIGAGITVQGSEPATLVWLEGEGAGKVCVIYHDNKLKSITVYNGKVSKKTRTDSAGNSHVDLNFRGDF